MRIQEFSSGGVQVSLTKKSSDNVFFCLFFFSPQLILQKSNGQFQSNLSFFKVPEGVQHFPGGSDFFQGGPNCLFPIETHITCDFPGGSPLSPPSGSALVLVCLSYGNTQDDLKNADWVIKHLVKMLGIYDLNSMHYNNL